MPKISLANYSICNEKGYFYPLGVYRRTVFRCPNPEDHFQTACPDDQNHHQDHFPKNYRENRHLYQFLYQGIAKSACRHSKEDQRAGTSAQSQQGRRGEAVERSDGAQWRNRPKAEEHREYSDRYSPHRGQHRHTQHAAGYPRTAVERPSGQVREVHEIHGQTSYRARQDDVRFLGQEPLPDVSPTSFRSRVCPIPACAGRGRETETGRGEQ